MGDRHATSTSQAASVPAGATLDYMSDAHSDAPASAPATNKRRRVHEPGAIDEDGDYEECHQESMDQNRMERCFKWACDNVRTDNGFLCENLDWVSVQKTTTQVALALFNAETARIATMYSPKE